MTTEHIHARIKVPVHIIQTRVIGSFEARVTAFAAAERFTHMNQLISRTGRKLITLLVITRHFVTKHARLRIRNRLQPMAVENDNSNCTVPGSCKSRILLYNVYLCVARAYEAFPRYFFLTWKYREMLLGLVLAVFFNIISGSTVSILHTNI